MSERYAESMRNWDGDKKMTDLMLEGGNLTKMTRTLLVGGRTVTVTITLDPPVSVPPGLVIVTEVIDPESETLPAPRTLWQRLKAAL